MKMRRFLKQIGVFLLFAILALFLLLVFHIKVIQNQNMGYYQAAILDKTERLKNLPGPKIILVGNSNVSFGFDSKLLEEAFGMPVINAGLHGGLGNAFHEELVREYVGEGDLVIVCHSDYSENDSNPSPDLLWTTLEWHAELWHLAPPSEHLQLVRTYPKYFVDSLLLWMAGGLGNREQTGTCYARAAFNEYGDICRRYDDRYTFGPGSVLVPTIGESTAERLNALNDDIRSRGAVMLVAGYPIGAGEYTPDASEFDAFEQELREKLNCDVISHYRDYYIPYDLFYNTYLHLSEEGAQTRTLQLINDLERWMEEQAVFSGE